MLTKRKRRSLSIPLMMLATACILMGWWACAAAGAGDKEPVKKIRKSVPPPPASTNGAPSRSTAPKPPLDPAVEKSIFQEVLQVLQERYAEPAAIGPKKISEAAVGALLDSLRGAVRLVEPEEITVKEGFPSSPTPLVDSSSVIDPFIGYIRVHRLEDGTVRQLQGETQKLVQQQHISSLILDLRFAQGTDFAVVPAMASLFFSENQELFSIQRSGGIQGYKTTSSTFSTDFLLVVLVNQETRGSAEVLAVSLQDQGRAVLIGRAPTAGLAYETTDTRLSNGKILRFASGKVTLTRKGDFFLKGVQPDITVTIAPQLEKDIYGQPFQPPALRAETRYFSEAILTGRDPAPPSRSDGNKENPNEPASNKDVVLQRAVDLLKGITALQL